MQRSLILKSYVVSSSVIYINIIYIYIYFYIHRITVNSRASCKKPEELRIACCVISLKFEINLQFDLKKFTKFLSDARRFARCLGFSGFLFVLVASKPKSIPDFWPSPTLTQTPVIWWKRGDPDKKYVLQCQDKAEPLPV